MNPLRYWARLVITANPKKIPRTLKELINVLLPNIIIGIIGMTISLVTKVAMIIFPPELQFLPPLFALILFFTLLRSLLLRMFKVNQWRKKIINSPNR